MSSKLGEKNYDLERYFQRGLTEFANALFPESPLQVRDHSGLYQSDRGDRGSAEPAAQLQPESPELEHDEPDLDR